MSDLVYHLDRQLVIRAHPDIVFSFFTESARWADWWGAGSAIEPRPGGRMYIRHSNGVEVHGEVVEVHAPERIVFTYGVTPRGADAPVSTLVTIHLRPHADGTLVQLRHDFSDQESCEHHVQGWRFQLSLFANLVANAVNVKAADLVDRWCAAWSNPDAPSRDREIDAIASPGIRFADRYSAIAGIEELRAHLAAVHRFMPGVRLLRQGSVRHCQWHVVADWAASGVDGAPRGNGTNLYVLDADGRISSVIGFWASA